MVEDLVAYDIGRGSLLEGERSAQLTVDHLLWFRSISFHSETIFLAKQPILTRRSTVLSLPMQ
jgi:hypothetical protein